MKFPRPSGPPMVFAPVGRTHQLAYLKTLIRTKPRATKNTHFDFLLQAIANLNVDAQQQRGDHREALWAAVASILEVGGASSSENSS